MRRSMCVKFLYLHIQKSHVYFQNKVFEFERHVFVSCCILIQNDLVAFVENRNTQKSYGN